MFGYCYDSFFFLVCVQVFCEIVVAERGKENQFYRKKMFISHLLIIQKLKLKSNPDSVVGFKNKIWIKNDCKILEKNVYTFFGGCTLYK